MTWSLKEFTARGSFTVDVKSKLVYPSRMVQLSKIRSARLPFHLRPGELQCKGPDAGTGVEGGQRPDGKWLRGKNIKIHHRSARTSFQRSNIQRSGKWFVCGWENFITVTCSAWPCLGLAWLCFANLFHSSVRDYRLHPTWLQAHPMYVCTRLPRSSATAIFLTKW